MAYPLLLHLLESLLSGGLPVTSAHDRRGVAAAPGGSVRIDIVLLDGTLQCLHPILARRDGSLLVLVL